MKVSEMDAVDIVMAYEEGTVRLEDEQDLNKFLEICKQLSNSNGSYGRLHKAILDDIEENGKRFPLFIA